MGMNILYKLRYVPALLFVLMLAPTAHAATTPSLGAAATYGVLSDTYSNPVGPTTINGDVGYTTAGGVTPLPLPRPSGTYPNYGSGGNYSAAGTAQAAALVNLNGQPCTFTFVAPNVVLDTTLEHVTTYAPGVYCSTGTMAVGTAGGITLSGAGTYIFRSGGALNMVAGATVNLSAGASACDVFWTPNGATTFNANSIFIGTVIPIAQDITVLSTTNMTGRLLSFGHTITTPDSNVIITVPVCAVVPPPASSGGPMTPPLINVRKVPTPLALPNGPGPVTYNYTVTNPGRIPIHTVTLTDDQCSNMAYLSGDTNLDSLLDVTETWLYRCSTTLTQTTVNYATARGIGNDMAAVDTAIAEVIVGVAVVPPLIHIVKTPEPLTLPFNGGNVVYTYKVTNPGTVALTEVTVTDNKCTGVTYVSGDMNADSMLQSTETWTYTCSTNVPTSMTNTAVATGHANDLTAIDTAIASVVVEGAPLPPLIHIIKKANPVILPASGGWVDYTYAVTNPGTVALQNVLVSDNKCNGLARVTGDNNGNALLDVNETWSYSCRKYIEYTTLNTATAQGSANGLTVSDIAIANVAVAPALIPPAPTLPNTGFGPVDGWMSWLMAAAGIFVGGTLLFALSKRNSLSK